MGLVLHSPSPDSEDFIPSEHRYLPARAGTEGLNPHAKHHRRPLGWSQRKLSLAQVDGFEAFVQDHGPASGSVPQDLPRNMQHIVNLARTNSQYNRVYDAVHCSSSSCRCRRTTGREHVSKEYRQSCIDTFQEGRALARSDVPLPGDDCRGLPFTSFYSSSEEENGGRGRSRTRSPSRSRSNSPPPSLGRQDAFRDASTSKKRSHRTMTLSRGVAAEDELEELYRLGLLYDNDDGHDDVEELYRIGLLYDNEHERGSGFTLGAIVHNEPMYQLHVRPAKQRGRRNQGSRQFTHTHVKSETRSGEEEEEEEAMRLELSLNLSYAALTDDAELAAFLLSESPSEIDIHILSEDIMTSKRRRIESPVRQTVAEPLTVIYELEREDDDFSQEDTTDERDGFRSINQEEEETDDDDFSQQDITEELDMRTNGFNNHMCFYEKEEKEEEEEEEDTWAFINDCNDFNECERDDAAAPLMISPTGATAAYICARIADTSAEQEEDPPQKETSEDTWIHV